MWAENGGRRPEDARGRGRTVGPGESPGLTSHQVAPGWTLPTLLHTVARAVPLRGTTWSI